MPHMRQFSCISIILALFFTMKCDRNNLYTELEKHASSSPGLIAKTDRNTTSERGDAATISIELTAAPSDNVTITASSSNTGEGQITSTLPIIFTASNWDSPQTIKITGQNDTVWDGDIPYTVIINTSSGDTAYNGLNKTFELTNNTNDRYIFKSSSSSNGNFDAPAMGGNNDTNGIEEADARCNTDVNRPNTSLEYRAVIVDGVHRKASATANAGDGQIDWVLVYETDYYNSRREHPCRNNRIERPLRFPDYKQR